MPHSLPRNPPSCMPSPHSLACPPAHEYPLSHMPPSHACPLHHACMPPPCTPPVMHAPPCHACPPVSCMPPAMYAPAMYAPLPCTLPSATHTCHPCPPHTPLPPTPQILRDVDNERAVRILLECILVFSHSEYELEGIRHMRMKFYVEGPFRKGTVHLEVKMVISF